MGKVKGKKVADRAPLPTIMEEQELKRVVPPRFAENLEITTKTDYNLREHCQLCGFWKSVIESVWDHKTETQLIQDANVCRYKPGEQEYLIQLGLLL